MKRHDMSPLSGNEMIASCMSTVEVQQYCSGVQEFSRVTLCCSRVLGEVGKFVQESRSNAQRAVIIKQRIGKSTDIF